MLGAQKKTLAGFSTATILPHTGFVYYTDIVQNAPFVSIVTLCYKLVTEVPCMVESLQDIRKKIARLIACKCTLAARVDSFHESPGGEIGERK